MDFSIRTFLVQLWIQGNLNLTDKDVKVMERRILLDDLIDQTSACMRDKLKLSLRTVYGQSYGYMTVIQDYCLAHGEKYYNPILLNEFQQELESRYERGEIKQGHYLGKRKCLERLT